MRFVALVLVVLGSVAAAQTAPSALFIVHLETGPKWDTAREASEQPSFREHSANMNRLREQGIIVFGARYDEFGLLFLKADTLDSAKATIEADPGVRAGIFVYRIAPLSIFYPWHE
jgi:hypothetical protein